MVTISLFTLLQSREGEAILGRGVMIGGLVLVLAGLADMATAGSNALAPFRTTTYTVMNDAEMAGMRRVIGLNTEASSYGATTLFFASSLLFIRPARTSGPLWRRFELPLALVLFVFCILSTSSSAYLGLAAAAVILVAQQVYFATQLGRTMAGHRATIQLIGLGVLLVLAALVLALNPQALRAVWEVCDEVLFKKAGSNSYLERMNWSRVSMAGLLDTAGYGLGAGSTRASSWAVALIASTGILGALLMTAFIVRGLFARLPRGDAEWSRQIVGARLAWLVCFVPAAGAATSIDFGLSGIFFAYMASAWQRPAIITGAIRNLREVRPIGARQPYRRARSKSNLGSPASTLPSAL